AVLNVFDDQLDRFIDPKLVINRLAEVTSSTIEAVVLNGDDQNCFDMPVSEKTTKTFFGLSQELPKIEYAKTYQPTKPRPAISYEAVKLSDRNLTVSSELGVQSFELPSRGVQFASDAVAALAVAERILDKDFNYDLACKTLNEIPPVFSRGEIRKINNEDVEFILIQNPISLQLNLNNLPYEIGPIMFAIGRDVHDPSWLWTVDYSTLKRVDMVSGFNYADAAMVLLYNDVEVKQIEEDYFSAIEQFLSLPNDSNGRKTVIYSADAMRRLRRHLGFTDPEEVKRV
ncbi:MAG: DUF1727 domain-containing protein, partial [Actinobacteria bacterium]|nr:DUF1727 domain-containing protein [Actinomycetota bacterium]